jgi:hypothetical protein
MTNPLTLVPKLKPPRPRKIRVKIIAEVGALPAALEVVRSIAADSDLSVVINVLSTPEEARS